MADANRLEQSTDGKEAAQATTRRQALQVMVAATAAGLGWSACNATHGAAMRGKQAGTQADDGALDHALRLLHEREPISRGGLSSHAPMVAEALCALGHSDLAVSRVEDDDARPVELPAPTQRIAREEWRSALGLRRDASTWEAANPRWGDWREFFRSELEEARWQDVLDLWTARLAPGLCSAATHGIIRSAHAARALSLRETAERRGELARGLAYWASSYEELPARAGSAARVPTFVAALDQVPLYWEQEGREPAGRNIVEALRHVSELERFGDMRDLVAEPEDLSAGLSALTETFARAYLQHGIRHGTIAFVHAVTGPSALRRIAPHVKPGTARAALPYAWQTAAAIFAAYARRENELGTAPPELSPAELASRAVENGDDHAIKLTEVLLAEHALNPEPVYLAAAQDAVERL